MSGYLYSWPLNNMGLNCPGPLMWRYFSVINTTVLHSLWLVESMDAEELQIWKTYMQINPSVVQGLAVYIPDHACVCACSVGSDSETPWTGAHQAPLSMGFLRQEYWSGLSFPSPGDLLDPGIKLVSPAFAGRFFTTEPCEKPLKSYIYMLKRLNFLMKILQRQITL